MSYNTLENYYKTIFVLWKDYNKSIAEIEDMIAFERDVYIGLLSDSIIEAQNQNIESQHSRNIADFNK